MRRAVFYRTGGETSMLHHSRRISCKTLFCLAPNHKRYRLPDCRSEAVEIVSPEDFSLPRHLSGNGLGLGMANLLILSPRSTVGFLPERRGSLRRPFYSSLLPESAMTRFSPPFLPVSRQEARRSSGSGTHQMRLTVNLKTAKTLGVEVSRSVLRAACSGLPRS
jgi:hypothetical protein